MFERMSASIDDEVQSRLVEYEAGGAPPRQRGATWTYLTTDEPFGPMTGRIIKGLIRMVKGVRGTPPRGE
jgi:hypothetical protein